MCWLRKYHIFVFQQPRYLYWELLSLITGGAWVLHVTYTVVGIGVVDLGFLRDFSLVSVDRRASGELDLHILLKQTAMITTRNKAPTPPPMPTPNSTIGTLILLSSLLLVV